MARKAVTDDFKVFPERLSGLMKQRKLKQQDLADYLGIQRQTVSLYMNGQSMPDAKQLRNMAEYFDVSADWLLGLSEIQTREADVHAACAYTGLSETAIQYLHWESHDKLTVDALSRILESDCGELHGLAKMISASMEYYQSWHSHGNIERPFGYNLPEEIQDEVFKSLDEWGGVMLFRSQAAEYYAAQAAHRLQNLIEKAARSYGKKAEMGRFRSEEDPRKERNKNGQK